MAANGYSVAKLLQPTKRLGKKGVFLLLLPESLTSGGTIKYFEIKEKPKIA